MSQPPPSPTHPCPCCTLDGELLANFSHDIAAYYRCGRCWHVWTVNRTTREIWHVTPLPKRQT